MHKPTNLLICTVITLWVSGIASAQADIYLDREQTDEIRLSNLSDENICCVLVAEAAPDLPATPAPVVAAVSASALPYHREVLAAASETAVEPALLHAVIAVESNHNSQALSPRGALGLMQLMPDTARRFQAKDPYNPAQNVQAGARYLRELSNLFHGDLNLTLAAYNAGPGSVQRYGGHIPPYAETQHYVPKVLQIYRALSKKRM